MEIKTTPNEPNKPNSEKTAAEIQKFNKELEERITAAATDKTKWKDILPELMESEVFVISQRMQNPDDPTNVSFSFLLLSNSNGQQAIPFFTSPNRLSAMIDANHKQFNCIKIKTVKFFQIVKGKPCVLNPRTPEARLFTPFEMNLLVMENLKKHPENTLKGNVTPLSTPAEATAPTAPAEPKGE